MATKKTKFIWEGYAAGDVLKVLQDGTLEGYRPGPDGADWTRYRLGRGGKAEEVSEAQALHAILLGRHPGKGSETGHIGGTSAPAPAHHDLVGTRVEGLQSGFAVWRPKQKAVGKHHQRKLADRTLRREIKNGHTDATLWSVEKGKLKEKLA